jgi:hypothetical protein
MMCQIRFLMALLLIIKLHVVVTRTLILLSFFCRYLLIIILSVGGRVKDGMSQ